MKSEPPTLFGGGDVKLFVHKFYTFSFCKRFELRQKVEVLTNDLPVTRINEIHIRNNKSRSAEFTIQIYETFII